MHGHGRVSMRGRKSRWWHGLLFTQHGGEGMERRGEGGGGPALRPLVEQRKGGGLVLRWGARPTAAQPWRGQAVLVTLLVSL
jgi:hypothetical protein